MAKKIFLITLVLSIISGIVTIAFIPLAIEDASKSVIKYNQEKGIDKSALTLQNIDNIEKIQILSWYDRIIIKKSEDNSPSVTKDQIAVQLSGSFADTREELHYIKDNIFCVRYGNPTNQLSMFSRENAMKIISAMFDNENKILTIYVPEGIEVYIHNEPYIIENNDDIPVFIDDKSSRSSNNNITYKSIDPSVDYNSSSHASSSSYASSSSVPAIAPPPSSSSGLENSSSTTNGAQLKTLEEVRTSLNEIMNKHNELYKGYIYNQLAEDYVRTELVATIDTEIEILKTVNASMNTYLSDGNNRNSVARCGELLIEKNILEIKSEMLEENYKKGLITKADYYTQDLEIDQEEDAIEFEIRNTADIMTANRTLRDLQNLNNIRIPMLYDID